MTTTPAMPELPEPDYWSTRDDGTPLFTAYQMRAYALATLQAQPAAAGVSDDELRQAVDALRDPNTVSAFYNGYYTLAPDELRRAILALRPQAVPMTPASRDVIMATRVADGDADEWPEPWAYRRGWSDAEAHHGITAPAGGEGKA